MSSDEIKVGSRWRSVDDPTREVKVLDVAASPGGPRVVYRGPGSHFTCVCDSSRFRREFFCPTPAPAVPAHYDFAIQPADAITAWSLNFAMGNVVKYVARADRKGTPLEDLRKAAGYLAAEIARREKGAPR